jgi:outer membrane protein assembly factor BamE (lipoprotein component of BamABCDE complex)
MIPVKNNMLRTTSCKVFSIPCIWKKKRLGFLNMKKRFATIALMLFALAPTLLVLAACTPTVATRGNLLTDNQFQQVQAQKSTRADVMQAWGPPTIAPLFEPDTWYYIGERTTQKGIFAPEVEKRRLVRVKFSAANNDTVVEVADLDPKLAENISPVSQTTPAAGKDFTFMQQFIGNIGKYNPSTDKKPQ